MAAHEAVASIVAVANGIRRATVAANTGRNVVLESPTCVIRIVGAAEIFPFMLGHAVATVAVTLAGAAEDSTSCMATVRQIV